MTSKLSTKQILQYITGREAFKEVLDQMAAQAANDGSDYNLIKNSSEYQKSYNFFSKPTNWKRETKHRYEIYGKKEDYDSFELGVLDWGEHNQSLCDATYKNWVNSGYNNKMLPIERIFTPDHELADNFRIEVTTTPDDTQIICWTAVVD